MKTLLFDKPCVQSVLITCISKLRMVFMLISGYDLMFEESRRDIKPLNLTKSNKRKQVLPTANGAFEKIQWHFAAHGEQRQATLAPAAHGASGYLNHES